MPEITVPLPTITVGRTMLVEAGGRPVLLCRTVDGLHASAGLCPHQNKSLEGARARGSRLLCPWHGAMFDLATGASQSLQLTDRPLQIYRCAEGVGSVTIALD